MMHEEILTPVQMILAERLVPALDGYYLAGGTAIALQIGHRRSLDFDFASTQPVKVFDLERRFLSLSLSVQAVLAATGDEFTVIMEGVKVTFFHYPFPIKQEITWERTGIMMPNIDHLAAMKGYALGRRSKWKDYVDLYFLLRFRVTMEELVAAATSVFGAHFNEKLFREQLCYFNDIDRTETVDFVGQSFSDEEICAYLQAAAIRSL